MQLDALKLLAKIHLKIGSIKLVNDNQIQEESKIDDEFYPNNEPEFHEIKRTYQHSMFS